MGFFGDLWHGATEVASSVGDAVSTGANQVGDALEHVDNLGHQYLGEAYDYIPIVSDLTSIGADAAHEVGDAGALAADVARGKTGVREGLGRAAGIGERMLHTGVDAGIAYTAGKVGGAAGKSYSKAAVKAGEKYLGKRIGGMVGKKVVGALAGAAARNPADELHRQGRGKG
jgi:hypothetical protein